MSTGNTLIFTLSQVENGTATTIELNKSESVAKLKLLLQRKVSIPANELLLFYNGQTLCDSYCIRDIDALFGSHIEFIDRRTRSALSIR